MDTCEWYDKFVFNSKSTEPYRSPFGFNTLHNHLRDRLNPDEPDDFDGIKL